MELLNDLIAVLDRKERVELQRYIHKLSGECKEYQLLALLSSGKEYTPSQLAGHIQVSSMRAYQQVRNRLQARILDFICTRRLNDAKSGMSRVLALTAICELMMERRSYAAAAKLLSKARELASRDGCYPLLEMIFDTQMSNAFRFGLSTSEIRSQWEEYLAVYEKMRELNMAFGEIAEQVALARQSGTTIEAGQIVHEVLQHDGLEILETTNPEFMLRVVQMARSVMMSGKDYHLVQPFIGGVYARLRANYAFGESNTHAETEFVYLLGHAYYRNMSFMEARGWTTKAMELVETLPASGDLRAKITSLYAAIDNATGDVQDAITRLEAVLEGVKPAPVMDESMNMRLNLAVYYFNAQEYRKSLKVLRELDTTYYRAASGMGREWLFKKDMITLIANYDAGKDDIAIKMLRNVRRKYADLMEQPVYSRAKPYLELVRRYMVNPSIASTEAFRMEVENAGLAWPHEREDLQAIAFFTWIRSKVLGRSHYELLVCRYQERKSA